VYRQRASGLLLIGPESERLRVALRDGQIIAIGPPVSPAPTPVVRPDDSVGLRLQKLLGEIGLRKDTPPRPANSGTTNLRDRLLVALFEGSSPAEFSFGADTPDDVPPIAGATEPLILEAVRRVPGGQALRERLGDLDQRLVATTALAEERTLTLTEGYLLSRIDGRSTAREVLQLIPLDSDETERTLLGLLLTGRVECRPAPPRPADRPQPAPARPDSAPLPEEPGTAGPQTGVEEAIDSPRAELPPMDPQTLDERREILELLQSLPLRNHFEVLGVRPGASGAEVKRAYSALVRRFHPDASRDPRLAGLRDILEAIFIRIGEAWEVLGDAQSRAAYEARFGVVRRPVAERVEPVPEMTERPAPAAPTPARSAPPPGPPAKVEPEPEAYVAPEDTLGTANLLLAQARYWDVIQMLEAAIPRMQPQRHQLRGRILLARAYAKNPNWVRRAEETLHAVMREDPNNADAPYELGLLYKAGGLAVRAQAMFRRTIELRPDHREAAAELGSGKGGPHAGLLKRLFGRGKGS
jgi:tetratricopeptide (TPR) repeat protein